MERTVSAVLEENICYIQQLFSQDKTVKAHRFQPLLVGGLRCCIFFVDGMVDSIRINESIIQPICTLVEAPGEGISPLDFLLRQVLQVNETQKETRMEALLRALLYGDTILFLDGSAQALILGSKGFAKRGISEPAGETYLKGPREGFLEPMLHNLAMLRRRLRTTDLKLEFFSLGDTDKLRAVLVRRLLEIRRRTERNTKFIPFINRVFNIRIADIYTNNHTLSFLKLLPTTSITLFKAGATIKLIANSTKKLKVTSPTRINAKTFVSPAIS